MHNLFVMVTIIFMSVVVSFLVASLIIWIVDMVGSPSRNWRVWRHFPGHYFALVRVPATDINPEEWRITRIFRMSWAQWGMEHPCKENIIVPLERVNMVGNTSAARVCEDQEAKGSIRFWVPLAIPNKDRF